MHLFNVFEQLLAAFALDDPLVYLGPVLGVVHPFQPLDEPLRRCGAEFSGRHPPHQLHLPGSTFGSTFRPAFLQPLDGPLLGQKRTGATVARVFSLRRAMTRFKSQLFES